MKQWQGQFGRCHIGAMGAFMELDAVVRCNSEGVGYGN
jgi:hypothetical protein